MSVKVSAWAWHEADAALPEGERLDPSELVVLVALADIADDDGRCTHASAEQRQQSALAWKCHTTLRTFQRKIATLQQRGLIEVERSSRTELNQYRLLVPWDSSRQIGGSRDDTGGGSDTTPVAARSSLLRSDVVKSSQKGSRMTPDWSPSTADLDFLLSDGPSLDVTTEVESFRDYWLGVPGQRGVKLDWSATWRNHVRRQHQYQVGRGWQPAASAAPAANWALL